MAHYKVYNTQNRDDHCPQHTNTLSYHKEMPHFKMHKVVLEVGTRYLGGKEEFVVCFRDPPPPLKLDNHTTIPRCSRHVWNILNKAH